MDLQPLRHRLARRRTLRGGAVILTALILLGGSSVAACTGDHEAVPSDTTAAMPIMPADVPGAIPAPDAAAAEVAAAMWAARPDYVRSHPMVEAAYEYAITNPHIVQWMPCYCGCGGMGHGSNLDCYLRRADGAFEEHASYCDICVEITLKTKELVDGGMNLRQVRTIVDQTWGGAAPGTPTALPPV